MASITIALVKKINSSCSNGFQFDIQDYRQLGDKNLSKTITIDENKLIKATLYYQNEIIEHREAGQKIPVLNVSIWTKSGSSTMWSSGLGKFHHYRDKKSPRRNIAVLQEITKEITDDLIKSMAVDNRDDSIFNALNGSSGTTDQ
ncbi:MAG TPA: hypothetical protein PKC55_10745 [Dysgonomonas sp.]|uniref:hypothetical protein n=1 Tax=unclassified Dysgonomonas TaxID=2630389 RepID=UPI0025BFEC41|nr:MULTISPECIES: hypothetical protein [unclassified Dysgonomonas]HML65297.1 hypothetical protein [Dysgonomonas sp.]